VIASAGIERDDLDSLVDQLAYDPRADAPIGTGDEKALRHVPTVPYWPGHYPLAER
jgi:hypothetical protein